MNLQAKLTLGAVVLETLIVGAISAVSLATFTQGEFDAALSRAKLVRVTASEDVAQALNRNPTLTPADALKDPALFQRLNKIMSASKEILEIAVVDPNNLLLADTDPKLQLGVTVPPYHSFEDLVEKQGWYEKLAVLSNKENRNYEVEEPLGAGGQPVVIVRVIVAPALIKNYIGPALDRNVQVALLSFAGAVGLTFLFSALAFRRLGQLGHMLDLVASGEYQPESPSTAKPNDELAVMASKVSLLNQRLRGAEFEVSDLRGNFDRLLQGLEDAVFIFDRDLRLIFDSGSVEKFLGVERSTLKGQPLQTVFPPVTTLGLLVAQSAQMGRPMSSRRVPSPVAAEGLPGVLLLSVDLMGTAPGGMSESGLVVRLRDPEAERKIGRELQTADRLAAISRITSGVAHEIKNPLNAMQLHMTAASNKLAKGDTAVEQHMEIIASEIFRLDNVVKKFLNFTRPVELNLTTVPVQDLVAEIVELARPQAEEAKIAITLDQQAYGAEVRVDVGLIKQALLNVAVNAMDVMPDGGELRFASSVQGDFAEIRVTDTGPGIPPKDREKIFQLYFTTKPQGSGIGLAMTFQMVQLHDGTIEFTSEPGKGATFMIRLPIAG